MFCPNCGTQLTGDARFCPTCGSPIEDGGAAGPSTAGPVAPAPAPAFVPASPAAPTAHRPAAPARQKKPRKKIVVAVAAVVALALVAGGAFAAYNIFVANKGEEADSEQAVDEKTPEQVRYQLYHDKCKEYLEQYGEPAFETVGPSDFVSDTVGSSDYATGFLFAKLIDFDGDGTEELVLARKDAGAKSAQTVVDVWTFDEENREINLASSEAPAKADRSGFTYLRFIDADGITYLDGQRAENSGQPPAFETMKDGSFTADDSLKRESSATASTAARYSIDGKDCSATETLYYLGPKDGSFGNFADRIFPKDTEATVHQTIDQLQKLMNGEAVPEQEPKQEQEAAQEPEQSQEQAAEQPAESAEQPITYTYRTDTILAKVPEKLGSNNAWWNQVSWRYSQIIPSTQSDSVDKINATIRATMESTAEWMDRVPIWPRPLREYREYYGIVPYFISSREISVSYIDDDYVCFLDQTLMRQDGDVHGGNTYRQGICFNLKTGDPVTPSEVVGITDQQLAADTNAAVTTFLEPGYQQRDTNEILGDIPTSLSFSDCISSNDCQVESVPATPYLVQENGVLYLMDQYSLGTYGLGTHVILVRSFPGGEWEVGKDYNTKGLTYLTQ